MTTSKCQFEKKWEAARTFLENLDALTDSWDVLCDCGAENGQHVGGCMTMSARADYDRVMNDE